LPIKQEDVLTPKGWSFECRIYAEDPLRNFLPSVGTLSTYLPPESKACAEAAAADGGGSSALDGIVRVDAGIVEGGEISVYYDPMISKLITHGPTRDAARLVMLQALDRYAIRGVRHNINFCRDLMAHPRFAKGDLTTAFIPDEYPDGYSGHVLSVEEHADLLACAASLQYAHERRWEGLRTADATSVVCSIDGGHRIDRTFRLCLDAAGSGAGDGVALGTAATGEFQVSVALTEPFVVTSGALLPSGVVLDVTGSPADGGEPWVRIVRLVESGLGPDAMIEARFVSESDVERPMAVQVLDRKATRWILSAFGTIYEVLARSDAVADLSKHMKPPPRSALDDALLSPMPGTLLSVAVAPGDNVYEGKELCVVEAMKMQNVLVAKRDGVVRALLAEPGATLSAEQPIVTFEPDETAKA